MARKPTRASKSTPKQNRRRYVLHQRIKKRFKYDLRIRTIYVLSEETVLSAPKWTRKALYELRDEFKYVLQLEIQ